MENSAKNRKFREIGQKKPDKIPDISRIRPKTGNFEKSAKTHKIPDFSRIRP
jgi:hypothetical protein